MSDHLSKGRKPPSEDANFSGQTQPHLVRVESNLLRLPLFALATKNLKTLDGIECSGEYERGGARYRYVFRATRNTDSRYPGPLSRTAHFALLDLVTAAGLPFRNPVDWTWYDLCRRMGVACSGRTVANLKAAISATHGLRIKSLNAVYSKAVGGPLPAQDVSEVLLTLYQKVVFFGGRLEDGTAADANYLWFSDWYLDNLNRLFSTPLNYGLWRRLDAISPIASRLYECLLLRFRRDIPLLQINYPTLAKMLPVKVERYLSDARKQFGPAFALLGEAGVVGRVEWKTHKSQLAKISIGRGRLLDPAAGHPAAFPAGGGEADGEDAVAVGDLEVRELRNVRPVEAELLGDFYRLLTNSAAPPPTKKELEQAKDLIDRHGQTKARALVPLIVKQLKDRWPDARRFAAASAYLPDALADYDRLQAQTAQRAKEKHRAHEARERERLDQLQRERLMAEWQGLPEEERAATAACVAKKYPLIADKPNLLQQMCLAEMRCRQDADPP